MPQSALKARGCTWRREQAQVEGPFPCGVFCGSRQLRWAVFHQNRGLVVLSGVTVLDLPPVLPQMTPGPPGSCWMGPSESERLQGKLRPRPQARVPNPNSSPARSRGPEHGGPVQRLTQDQELAFHTERAGVARGFPSFGINLNTPGATCCMQMGK